MKRILAVAAIVALLGLGAAAWQSEPSEAQGHPTFQLPDQARAVAPGVFFLGHSVEDGTQLEGYAFVHPRPAIAEHHRPGHAGGPGGGGSEPPSVDASSCFSFIARSARWRTAEPWLLDTSENSPGLTGVQTSDFANAFGAWESASGADIWGAVSSGSGLSADTSSTDGLNEVYFADITDPGVLGFTIVWYSRGGPPSSRAIVESDMVIDDGDNAEIGGTYWPWWLGNEGDGTIGSGIDLRAVLTHEGGHYAGLGHTSNDSLCLEQTMYPSIASGGDTKQSLGVGDIAGINELY